MGCSIKRKNMNKFIKYTFLGISFMFIGCGGYAKNIPLLSNTFYKNTNKGNNVVENVKYEIVYKTKTPVDYNLYMKGKRSFNFYRTNNKKEMSEFKKELLRITKNNIDTKRNGTFIILEMGTKNVGGYDIAIDKIVKTNDKIIIMTHDVEPKGQFVTTAFENPIKIIFINNEFDDVYYK